MENKKIFTTLLSGVSSFSNNKYIQAVSNSMMALIGIMLLGSFSVILLAFPIKGVSTFLANIGIIPYLSTIMTLTINSVSIYLVFLISKNLADKFGLVNDSYMVGVTAIMAFLLVTPIGRIVDGESSINAIPITWLGTSGMFSAIIIGLSVGRIYVYIVEKKWVVKMPESVPPMISRSFAALTPMIIIGIIATIVAYIFGLTSYGCIHQFVFGVIQTPLQGIGSSIWAVMLIIAFQQLLWFIGIHGTNVINPVVQPLWTALNVANLTAYSAGLPVENIVTASFVTIVCWGGSALGLVLLMLFKSKSKRYKELGKLAIVPALFGITEPVIFGTPLVMNAKLAFPFILNNSIFLGLAYALTQMGIVQRVIGVAAIFGMPVGFHALIGGHFSLVLLQLVIQLILSPLLWYPWFRAVDKEAYQEELDYNADSLISSVNKEIVI